MSESEGPEQYKGLSPEQLNSQLARFFHLMPVSNITQLSEPLGALTFDSVGVNNFGAVIGSFQEGVEKDRQRRITSEPLTLLQRGLRNILSLSYLNPSAIEEVIDRYSTDFSLGLNGKPDQSDLAKILGINNANYAGSFHPESAKVIDDELFEAKAKKLERLEFVQKARSSGRPHSSERLSMGEKNLQRMREQIETWQKKRSEKAKKMAQTSNLK